MGFDCEVNESFEFIYQTELDDDLIEHEYDHVLVGKFDGNPNPSKDEVDDWKWIDMETLKCCSKPRVLLVGDAAGIDPLFGEGITSALALGAIAAQSAFDSCLSKLLASTSSDL